MKSHRLVRPVLFAIVIAGVTMHPAAASAQISIGVGISLPVPIVFVAPPQVVVLPGFDIYVAPDIAEEIYFVDGYWWRPWQGRWYRSTSYNSGWGYYANVPYFYSNVRLGWRNDYRNHRWEGNDWNYERMSHQRVEQNWSSWKSSRHWEKQQNWGVPEMKSGKQRNDERSPGSALQQRDPQMKSSRATQDSPQPKAAKQQQQRSSQPEAVKQPQRSSQPKAAQQKQHSSQPKASQQKQHSSQPKAASSKQGGTPAKAEKQNSPQDKGGSGAQSKGDKGQGSQSGHNGGGKDKK